MTKAATKDSRWNLRVAPQADEIVRDAASRSHRTLSDFVLQAAVAEAERVLADRTRFELDEASWDRFVELIERPAQENERLAALLARPSVFD
jgi:uncharacterized protein (DUF1778 family)